jgi:flavin-dependent dehydrogenase
MSTASRYDAIVVGARVAGAPTAMLLARQGLRVLLLDRARFPSDTVSSHQVQVPATAALRRWGLLDAVLSDEGSATRRVSLDVGDVVVSGTWPVVEGEGRLVSPRRTRLDQLLITAAMDAGAEVESGFTVERVLIEDGRATGVSGRLGRGARVTLRADLVVGADGKRSLVARQRTWSALVPTRPSPCTRTGRACPSPGRSCTTAMAVLPPCFPPTTVRRSSTWPRRPRRSHVCAGSRRPSCSRPSTGAGTSGTAYATRSGSNASG